MIPSQSGRPVLNPHQVLERRGGLDEFKKMLREVGYVPQIDPLNDFVKSVSSNLPLLCDGSRGAGKTAFGEAIAEAFNLPLAFLPCFPDTSKAEILGEFDETLRTQTIDFRVRHRKQSPNQAQRDTRTLDFYVLGEVLAAYEHVGRTGNQCVLIVDEIDKLLPQLQYTLLQIFARGFADIPLLQPQGRLGIVNPEARRPIVLLTSNDMEAGVSPLIRSRCLHTYFELPTMKEEVGILHARVPAASPDLLIATIKLFDSVRSRPFTDKPGLRETIEFLKQLVRTGITAFDEEVLHQHTTYLMKNPTDRKNFRKDLSSFVLASRKSDVRISSKSTETIEQVVQAEFANNLSLVKEEA